MTFPKHTTFFSCNKVFSSQVFENTHEASSATYLLFRQKHRTAYKNELVVNRKKPILSSNKDEFFYHPRIAETTPELGFSDQLPGKYGSCNRWRLPEVLHSLLRKSRVSS